MELDDHKLEQEEYKRLEKAFYFIKDNKNKILL